MMGQENPRITFTLDNLGYSYSKNKDYARALTVSDVIMAPFVVLLFLFLLGLNPAHITLFTLFAVLSRHVTDSNFSLWNFYHRML
jgi:hypothetical protein